MANECPRLELIVALQAMHRNDPTWQILCTAVSDLSRAPKKLKRGCRIEAHYSRLVSRQNVGRMSFLIAGVEERGSTTTGRLLTIAVSSERKPMTRQPTRMCVGTVRCRVVAVAE
jgi:hypothetical protein